MAQGTKILTASGEIASASSSAKIGVFVLSITQGTGSSTVRIRDNNISGTIIWEEVMATGTHRVITFNSPNPLKGEAGAPLYCEITSTGTSVSILYTNSIQGD